VNPQDPLAALHPLREPAAIGWWPLAPGWWLLIALAVLAIAVACYYLVKRYRANAYRRLALQQLQAIHTKLNQSDDSDLHGAVSNTNALLKSVALRQFPRHDIASLSGDAWLGFLNSTRRSESTDTEFSIGFAKAAYQPQVPQLDTEQLFRASKNWIVKHRAPA
jgi:hypothetical protein